MVQIRRPDSHRPAVTALRIRGIRAKDPPLDGKQSALRCQHPGPRKLITITSIDAIYVVCVIHVRCVIADACRRAAMIRLRQSNPFACRVSGIQRLFSNQR